MHHSNKNKRKRERRYLPKEEVSYSLTSKRVRLLCSIHNDILFIAFSISEYFQIEKKKEMFLIEKVMTVIIIVTDATRKNREKRSI